ncbi:hypothetical protein [Flexibacterium corallicola]|uniref:hypothetical protein n=1 Tax=Flexibacterium corallicola TaxID=3037259 RepID=UPI00286F329C|nr:hypothetical protein [Pseudovibrio sp. M1P-2-3]
MPEKTPISLFFEHLHIFQSLHLVDLPRPLPLFVAIQPFIKTGTLYALRTGRRLYEACAPLNIDQLDN